VTGFKGSDGGREGEATHTHTYLSWICKVWPSSVVFALPVAMPASLALRVVSADKAVVSKTDSHS